MKLYYYQNDETYSDGSYKYPSMHLDIDSDNTHLLLNFDPEVIPAPDSGLSTFLLSGGAIQKFALLEFRDFLSFYRDRQIWVLRGRYLGEAYHTFDLFPAVRDFFPPMSLTMEILSIVIPFYDSPIEDWFLTVNARDLYVNDSDLIVETVEESNPYLLKKDLLYKFNLTMEQPINEGGSGVIGVELVDNNGNRIEKSINIIAHVNSGYLPKTEITLNNGFGAIDILPIGLHSGDEVRVDVGVGVYKDISSAILTVV